VSAICFSLPDATPFGQALATTLGIGHGALEVHRFPDGETSVRLDADCAGRSVVLVGAGRDPNPAALPLCFAAHAAREMGAARVGLVAPYLPYMRQDARFRPGEAVSARAYARFLSSCFDWMATVDPHLHRIRSLGEVFTIPALCVSSAPAIAQWIGTRVMDPVIVGPDAESAQWVEQVACMLGAPWTVLAKTRRGDREVSVDLPDAGAFHGRSPVIVDDIASSGRTLVEASRALRGLGCAPVTCVVVHALLAADAEAALRGAGVQRLVSTNTVAHPSNGIDVVPGLAAAVRAALGGGPRAA
jgi:ribose-phosphate pyrophosphokinase